MYAIHFGPPPPSEEDVPDGFIQRPSTVDRDLTLDERAVSWLSLDRAIISNLNLAYVGPCD